MKRFLAANITFNIIKLFVSIFVIFLGYSYLGPLYGTLMGVILASAICIIPKYISFKEISLKDEKLFLYSFSGLIGSIAFSILSNSQYVIISILKNVSTTGIFGVAMAISTLISVAPNVLSNAIYPIISSLSFDKEKNKSKEKLLEETIRYAFFFSIPMILTFSIFPELFVMSFSSNKFIAASKLLPILGTSVFLYSMSTMFLNSIYALNKPKIYRNILILIVFIFLMTTITLTYFLSDLGTALGHLITMVIFLSITFFELKKIINIKFPLTDIIKIFISSILFFVLYFVKPYVINLIIAGILISVVFILYLLSLRLMKFYKKEDARILKHLFYKVKFAKPITNFILKMVES